MTTARGIVAQALPALGLTALGALVAGVILGHLAGRIEATPGMLILVPALMGLRGNISGSLASRLSSATHLGLVSLEEPFNRVGVQNLIAGVALSAGTGAFAGFLGWAVSHALGLESSSLLIFLAVAGLTGTLAGFVLSFLTLFIVLIVFKRGVDPDNVAAPLLSTVGDIVTLLILALALVLVGG